MAAAHTVLKPCKRCKKNKGDIGKTGFSDKLTVNLINAGGRALTNTAINGGNLEEALRQALVGGLVDTAHGQVASQIKVLESEYLAHKLAHALAGCVAGAAASGTCKDGAIGAAVGEVVAQMFDSQKPGPTATKEQVDAYNQKVLGYSKLVAGAVSAYAGGNAQTAMTTAEIAVQNNYLSKPQLIALQAELEACKNTKCNETQVNAVLDKYARLSASNDAALANCTTQACVDTHRKALADAASLSAGVMRQVANTRGDEQLINQLLGRENKAFTLQFMQGKTERIEQARKELDQYVQTQCKGLSTQACTTKLQASQSTASTVTEILTGFTLAGIAIDIKDLLQAKTMQDRSLAVLGTVLPGLGDAVKGLVKGANGGVIAGTAGDSLAVVAKPTYVFRGDGRPPAQIFDEGFKASGTNTDVLNHATTNTNSGLISTSSTPNVAREFADMQVGGYVYTVRKPPQALDVNATLGAKSPYPQEFEIAVPGAIRPQDILGARQVGPDGKFVGPYVKNTGFQP